MKYPRSPPIFRKSLRILIEALSKRQNCHQIVMNYSVGKESEPGISPQPRELLVGYVGDVNTIFIGDPNVDRLLQSYQDDVKTIFDTNPPGPDKQIRDFRGLTHDFEKAVIGAFTGPE